MIGKNNPMNIRDYETSHWIGQIGSTRGFVDFDSRVHCFRAFWKILVHYKQLGINNIDAVLRRYSPPSENATYFLVNRAVLFVGKERTAALNSSDWFALGCAIFKQENGFGLYDDRAEPSDFQNFYDMYVKYFYNNFYNNV